MRIHRAMGSNKNVNLDTNLSCRDWIVLITLPMMTMASSFDNLSMGALLPLLQDYFNTNDTEAAYIKTFQGIGHIIAVAAMWLFGDFVPKKKVFVASVALWILISFASILVSSEQFRLFILLRALASTASGIIRLLVTVLEAEQFSGQILIRAITATVVGENIAARLSAPINSIFVANHSGWRLGAVIGPICAIPLLFLSIVFLRGESSSMPKPISILRNAFSVLRILSYTLLLLSQCLAMFYFQALIFWLPSFTLYAFESVPDVFLGLSYPAISSLTANISFAGMLIGCLIVPYTVKSLRASTGLLAVPIVNAVSAVLESLIYLTQVTMVTTCFPALMTAYFADGIAGDGFNLMNIQIILDSIPSQHHASALSLSKLMVAVGDMPAAQIIGAISNHLRGDSTSSLERMEALQQAFLYTWPISLASTLLSFVIFRFYKRDVEKADELNQRHRAESKSLLGLKTDY